MPAGHPGQRRYKAIPITPDPTRTPTVSVMGPRVSLTPTRIHKTGLTSDRKSSRLAPEGFRTMRNNLSNMFAVLQRESKRYTNIKQACKNLVCIRE